MVKKNFKEILNLTNESMEDLRYVAYSYLRAGKYDLATLFFESLLILNNEQSYDLKTLGALYLQQGDNVKALDLLDKALKKEKDFFAMLNRAKALLGLGYKKQALIQAQAIVNCEEKNISSQAAAIIEQYTQST
jgi:tetratricopeptide (TPR) repeat protein